MIGGIVGSLAGGVLGQTAGKHLKSDFVLPVGGMLLGGHLGGKLDRPEPRASSASPKRADWALGCLRGSLQKLARERDEKLQENRRALRQQAARLAPLYRTRSAQGWDVLAETVATDVQGTPGR